MKAVNLIPVDERKGGGAGRAGRSGGAVYAALGALAVIAAVAGANATFAQGVQDEQAKLTTVSRQADAAEAQARALAPYSRFAALRTKREQTVKSLAESRFDWAHALHEVSRVIPTNAWLTQMLGTVSPSVAVDGGVSTAAGGLRQSQQVPAIEVTGCTTSQNSVAKMISQMRLIDGVTRVSLAVAEKGAKTESGSAGEATAGSGGGGGASDCRNGHDQFPKFDLVVFFRASGATAPSTTQAAAATTTTPATTGTTPSATTTTTTTATTPAGAAQ